ncbi:hypothetical protein LTR05_004772 [Lithohypha guttulata]|uniref:Phosphatidate phosphatase APP1 catalytic domain-containing protein n=1 Tax=Lithohypha guttulata TaxID=1690604 RepID=A0AAN7YGA1_9EURO|nr:hypothetical protein LTR05_004772 [Lithohypha guttulata]
MANSGWAGESRAPGQRRQKVLGYIKAANELRQSYQQTFQTRWQESDYQEGLPGAFPDADVVRSGDEEMLLFPSYARIHAPATHHSQGLPRSAPGTNEDVSNPDSGDADYWRREWQKYEDVNAVVDVDVRGWIYTPQRGPLSRRNRLLLAVARRLSGIPAPTNTPPRSRETSQGPGWRDRVQDDMLSQEEEAAAREADLIQRRGQREAEAAATGRYTADNDSLMDFSPTNSRASSPSRPASTRMNTSTGNDSTDAITPLQKRMSWNLAGQMSKEEIIAANEQLMKRLRPFMTLPTANSPITIFFYNDNKSQSKSVYTDDSGHFKVRAALNFVPTKVRVLASENLSATEDVNITNERGISLVSDIDDTIKHSAIASGAKEIFKNTFIRELGELVIPGVKEWYSKMASLGVKLHYVSNSPWQLYPVLKSYFALAGLPPGSFHLKQYTGMLQGIFEPAAERKKGSLDRIMHDFPERKFVLVGDSGEADLEVYTDIVQEHPGRVLAVFIRDVTSREENDLKEFFNGNRSDDASTDVNKNPSQRESQKSNGQKPGLPERPKPTRAATENLIDFGEDSPSSSKSEDLSYSRDMEALQLSNKSPQRPAKPAKPSNLRSMTTATLQRSSSFRRNEASSSSTQQNSNGSKTNAPPPPPAPRRTATGLSTNSTTSTKTSASDPEKPSSRNKNAAPSQASYDSRTWWQDNSSSSSNNNNTNNNRTSNSGYLASARQQLNTAYNALPTIRSPPSRESLKSSSSDLTTNPPLPPRRGLSSYPAAAARFVTGANLGDPAAGGDGGTAPGQPLDRKLEMWKRRWQRSEEIMRKQGVVLRAWKTGSDVMDECLEIVEREFRRVGIEDVDRGESNRKNNNNNSNNHGESSRNHNN